MKATTIITAAAAASGVSAWKIKINAAGGRFAEVWGTWPTQCTNMDFNPPLRVTQFQYEDSAFVSKYRFWENRDCTGATEEFSGGMTFWPPRLYQSYRVYI